MVRHDGLDCRRDARSRVEHCLRVAARCRKRAQVLKILRVEFNDIAPAFAATFANEAAAVGVDERMISAKDAAAANAARCRWLDTERGEQSQRKAWQQRLRPVGRSDRPEHPGEQLVHIGKGQIGFAKRVDEFRNERRDRETVRLNKFCPR